MVDFHSVTGPEVPASAGKADSLVVLLHGLGADGQDLIGLASEWRSLLPTTAFAAPDAPFACDMAPYGRQWFSMQDMSEDRIFAGIAAAGPILDSFLDELLARTGVSQDRLALVGFSQGTMMALYVAPRRLQRIAGVVGFSGALVGANRLAAEVRHRPPVLLVHGDADPIVPFGASSAAADALRSLHFPVDFLRRPGLPHAIDPAGIAAAGSFLTRVFGSSDPLQPQKSLQQL